MSNFYKRMCRWFYLWRIGEINAECEQLDAAVAYAVKRGRAVHAALLKKRATLLGKLMRLNDE